MILMEVPYLITSNLTLRLLKLNIIKNLKLYSNKLTEFFKLFSEKDIENAIQSLSIVNGYIKMPSGGVYGEILRSIEYGTSYMKAFHIITKSVKELSSR